MDKYSSVTIALTISTSIMMLIAATTIIYVSQTGQLLPVKLWLTSGFYLSSSVTGFASIPLLLKERRSGNLLSLSSAIFGLIGFSIVFTSVFLETPARGEILMLAVGGLSFILLVIVIATSTIGFSRYRNLQENSRLKIEKTEVNSSRRLEGRK